MLNKMVVDINYADAIFNLDRAIDALMMIGEVDKFNALIEIRDACKKERGELHLYK